MCKIVTVTSGKGGTGKTTTAAALSSCLAMLGHKTLCIDFDIGLGNLDLALGIPDFTVMDFSDVVQGRVELPQAYIGSPHIEDLYYLAAPCGGEMKVSDHDAYIKMLADVRKDFDFCVIDSPPGIGYGFALAHIDADMSVIVTTGELPAMRDATRAAGRLRDMGIENIRLLINRLNAKNLRKIKTTVDDIIDETGVRLIGIIPEDKSVFRALHKSTPLIVSGRKRIVNSYLDTALRITGEDVPLQLY